MALENKTSHDDRIVEALSGRSVAAEDHLLTCPPCREERERLKRQLDAFSTSARVAAENQESYWTSQAAQVHSRISDRSSQRASLAGRLVPALAILAVFAFLLLQGAPAPQPRPAQAVYSDHDLLVAVERALQRDTPAALEPVSLLVEDMVRPSPANPQKFSKEPTHHDN